MKRRRHHEVVDIKKWIGLFPISEHERKEGPRRFPTTRPGDPLEPTDYGPKEPARRVAVSPQDVDVVVTPGLAFDREGRRLGYGGGYYDRYLSRLHPHAVRIGIGFSRQVVEEVPEEDGDETVDVIVTDDEVIRVSEPS